MLFHSKSLFEYDAAGKAPPDAH